MRKTLILGAAAGFLAVQAAAAEPLKIAMIEALSGPLAQTGITFTDGMRYGVAKLNDAGGFNGEKITLLEYDNQGGPTGAADKLKIAISEGARIVASASSSAVAAQLSDDIRKYNLRNPSKELIYYNVGSEAYELTAQRCHFWMFRVGTNAFIRYKALVKALGEEKLINRVYTINQNYSYGLEAQTAQQRYVKDAGGNVVGSAIHDLSKVQDFAPYIAKVKESGATFILTGNWGSDIILLMRAAGESGSNIRFGNQSLDTPGTISAAGPAALGSFLAKLYNLEAGGEAGKAFIEDFKAKIGRYPYSEEPTSAFGMMLLGEALKTLKFNGGPIDAKAIAFALEKASYQTPLGPWRFRTEDHQLIPQLTISEVSRDAKYKVDNTDMGFKLRTVVPAEDATVPVAEECKMQRPS
jgi:branched-chain amino acid transport system substrate-binding protein